MVEIFIDEGGQFTQASGWSVVCALALPHAEVGRLRRKLAYLTRDWPRASSGELKGGSLGASHLAILVEELYRRDGLLFATAIDMAREDDERLKDHKLKQGELITAFLTPRHHANLVEEVKGLRRTLEGMPVQLYVQSVLMTELTAITVEEVALYFAQRRPQELGHFKWTIDAKDPRRVTTQERWWRDTLGPLQESRSRRTPMERVDDPEFDYRSFDKAYEFEKMMWYPDKPSERITGYDIRKILSSQIDFKDSRADILLQAIDILTNFLRRILIGRVTDPSVASSLGRMQILRRREDICQSVTILTLTGVARAEIKQIGRMMRMMSMSGRPMIRARKTRQPLK